MHERRFENKIVLITGSSRGIGRAMAERFSAEGAKIAINYAKDERAASELREKLQGSEMFKADVSDRVALREMVKDINEKMGNIDVLINNAGIMDVMPFEEYDERRFERMYSINVKGAVYAALETMNDLKKRHGVILNVASNAGIGTAAENTTFYSMTKAAIIILTKRLAFELRNYGIRVNAIAPGWVESDMTIGGRSDGEIEASRDYFRSRTELHMTGKPEYIANVATFLCSEESSFINGQVVVADGGRIDNLTHSV